MSLPSRCLKWASRFRFVEPSFSGTTRLRDKSDMAWNQQFDFCSRVSATPNFQPTTHAFGTPTHAGQSPVSVSARLKYVRIYARAIVANQDFQVFRSIFKLDLDLAAAGVAKCIC